MSLSVAGLSLNEAISSGVRMLCVVAVRGLVAAGCGAGGVGVDSSGSTSICWSSRSGVAVAGVAGAAGWLAVVARVARLLAPLCGCDDGRLSPLVAPCVGV